MSNVTDSVTLAFADDVATITLNRPDKRNALSEAMWGRLGELVAQADAMPEAKIIVIRGAGDHFAAGADIGEFADVYESRERATRYSAIVAGGVNAIASATKPVIASIRGVCVGGGLAIALACDIRMAARDGKFGITPAKLGLVYSLNDTKRLVDAVGASKAKDILFTARIMDAESALEIGLVDEIHPPDGLDAAVAEKCALIAASSQWTVRKAKEIVRLILSGTAQDTQQTRGWFLDAVEQVDFREGRDAFMNKRKPNFPYR